MENNEAARVKSVIKDLQEKVYELRLFDPKNEVNAYCDDLACQVVVAIESIINSVNKLQEKLLGDIETYRNELISSEAPHELRDDDDEVKRQLSRLSAEVEALASDQKVTNVGLSQLDELKKRSKHIRRLLRKQAFNGRFKKFIEGQFYRLRADALCGRLEMFGQDVEDETRIKHFILEGAESKATVFRPFGFDESRPSVVHFNSLLFLSDDNLAVYSIGLPIAIVNLETRLKLFELEQVATNRHFPIINTMAQLPNGNLAAGTEGGHIIIWDLATRKHVASHRLSIPCIKSLRASPSGLLACSYHDEILIIDPSLEPNNSVLFSITGPSYFPLSFEMLANGQLATLDIGNRYTIWDLEKRAMTKAGVIGEAQSRSRKILPSAEVVLYLEDGSVRLHSLMTGLASREFHHEHGEIVDVVDQSDGSILFVHLSQLTNQTFRDLVCRRRSILAHKCLLAHSLTYSSSGRVMAYGSDDGNLIIWSLID